MGKKMHSDIIASKYTIMVEGRGTVEKPSFISIDLHYIASNERICMKAHTHTYATRRDVLAHTIGANGVRDELVLVGGAHCQGGACAVTQHGATGGLKETEMNFEWSSMSRKEMKSDELGV